MYRDLLIESEEKYRTLTQNLNVAVYRAHMYGHLEAEIVELNPAFLKMFRYESLEEVQLIDRGALFASHEERVRFNKIMSEQGNVVDMEILLKRKDGSTFMGEITGIIEKVEGREYDIWDGIIEDISLRKSAEDWVDFLNTLLGHDIANKIHIVHGFLSLLDKSEVDKEGKALIRSALKASSESLTLLEKIRRIRDFNNINLMTLERLDLIPILKRVSDLYSGQNLSSGMQIDLEYEDRSYEILAGEFLSEVFSNLIENSILHSKGQIVKISLIDSENHVTIRIEDDGRGVPDNIKQRIYERGVKGEDSKGTGLGLYLVNKIIEGLNGKIVVSQSEMGGARFDVNLLKN